MPLTIQYAPAKLVVVTIPKSGSTTLMAAFLMLAGFAKENPRRFMREQNSRTLVEQKGLVIKRMEPAEIKRLQAEFEDYYFVVVMRDPAKRLLSGYLNKINRYCKKFALPIYVWGRLRQFLANPSSWGDINCCNRYMRQHVSFESFVASLEQHGISWDRHFELQTIVAATETINYQEIIHLEVLDSALADLLARRGIDRGALDSLKDMGRFNATDSDNRQSLLTDSIQRRIASLYKNDYDFLRRFQNGRDSENPNPTSGALN